MSASSALHELRAAEAAATAAATDAAAQLRYADVLAAAAFYADEKRTPGRTHADLLTQAIGVYQRLLPHSSEPTVVRTNLGAALSDLGRHRAAASILRTAIEAGDADRNTHFNLAVALMNTGAPGRAEAKRHFATAAATAANPATRSAFFDPLGH